MFQRENEGEFRKTSHGLNPNGFCDAVNSFLMGVIRIPELASKLCLYRD